MIPLKSEKDLEMLKISGQILAGILQRLKERVKAGVTTLELDSYAAECIAKAKVVSAFKGYRGFPAHICTSINEEVVHGIPADRPLHEGDILSIDVGIEYKGYFSDAAVTIGVGKIEAKTKKLIEVAKNALSEGILKAREDNRILDISAAVQDYVEKHGFSVVRQFVGHGIGTALHEEPEIPNFGRPHQGSLIKNGMVFAIEPMVNIGGWECEILDNDWTAVTKDRLFSAHFEHTVAVTKKGPEILTRIYG